MKCDYLLVQRCVKLTLVLIFIFRISGSHQFYVSKYVFCEALNLANVVLQLYLMNFFLGGQFFDYGMDILRVSELPIEERVDPMSKVFPKVSHIEYHFITNLVSENHVSEITLIEGTQNAIEE